MATEIIANGVSPLELNDCEIVVTTKDGRTFPVALKLAKASKMINTMVKDVGERLDLSNGIPLPEVNGDIFEQVLEWCKNHEGWFLYPPILIIFGTSRLKITTFCLIAIKNCNISNTLIEG